jgi:hypothetical protein
LNKEKWVTRGSFPFMISMKERIRDLVRMLPKTQLKAAHLVKVCALKLAHQETLKAFQL